MPTFNRYYSRFIPSEEVGDVTQWKFGSVDGSGLADSDAQAVAEIPMTPMEQEAAREAMLQEACAQAYAQGQADTALEWQRRMDEYIAQQGSEVAQRLNSLVATLDQTLNGLQQRLAQEVLELACDIARQVLRQELVVNSRAIEPVVREAVGMLLGDGRPTLVRLHPRDMETLEQPLRDELADSGVQWVADAAVDLGGCLVESAGTVVDARIEKRWERAIAALGLQSAWQEPDHGT